MMAHPVELFEDLTVAVSTGQAGAWREALQEQSAADPFRALRNERSLEQDICEVAGFPDLVAWIMSAQSWVDALHRTTSPLPVRAEILRAVWDRFDRQLSTALGNARSSCSLPKEGGVLAFVDGLALCLVISYRFVGEVPTLEVIDVIENPRTAFDVVDDLLRRSHPTRTELKRMLQSSHRLIWHRDVLGHVDRRDEPSVFGPSIDTLHLAELLAREYLATESFNPPARVLEVGTGSGFLSAGLLRHLAGLTQLVGLDPDINAAVCTNRNWSINAPSLVPSARTTFVISPLLSDVVGGGFDLVVCNPPYVPDPPWGLRDRSGQRMGAVAGTALIDVLLVLAPSLLAEAGRMLLVTSSVTPPEYVLERLPQGVRMERRPWGARGKEVLFELEEIFRRPGYLEHLEAQGGLVNTGVNYIHHLHAFWLVREPEGG